MSATAPGTNKQFHRHPTLGYNHTGFEAVKVLFFAGAVASAKCFVLVNVAPTDATGVNATLHRNVVTNGNRKRVHDMKAFGVVLLVGFCQSEQGKFPQIFRIFGATDRLKRLLENGLMYLWSVKKSNAFC